MKIKNVDKNNFKDEVISSNIPVLVDFNATWCGPCKMIRPILDEIASDNENIKIVSIDVDKQQELASEYGVISIPCLVLFKNGKEEKRIIGMQPKEYIESFIG